MANIGDALLGLASGAADVINKDAEANREFLRKQKAKMIDSRIVRQEKEYDKKKADWDFVNKYGTGQKAQYMYAMQQFKDADQAEEAMKLGTFAGVLSGIKDPGQFTPYSVAVSDEEVLRTYGDDSIAAKIMGSFGSNKARRTDQRVSESNIRGVQLDELSTQADMAVGLLERKPGASSITFPGSDKTDIEPGTLEPTTEQIAATGPELGVVSIQKDQATGKVTTTINHSIPARKPEEAASDYAARMAALRNKPTVDIQRDEGQLITILKDKDGQVISSKATAIENYKSYTRPEVDLKRGIATWSETDSAGNVRTFAGEIENLPEEAKEGFKVQNATFNAKLGGYTILEVDEDTDEMKTTFLQVDGVEPEMDQSKIKWMSFKAEDPKTGETVTKWAATTLNPESKKIEIVDSIQVITETTSSQRSTPAPQFQLDRAFTTLLELQQGGGDAGDILGTFSEDQLRSLAREAGDEAERLATQPGFREQPFSVIEQQAILRVLKARHEAQQQPTK